MTDLGKAPDTRQEVYLPGIRGFVFISTEYYGMHIARRCFMMVELD